MATEDDIRKNCALYTERFTANDREGWLDLWADDATMEDPVGSPVRRGKAEIVQLYDQGRELASEIQLRIVHGPAVNGHEAAFGMEVRTRIGDAWMVIPAVDVMSFGEDGRITSQRAFWNAADVHPA